MSVALTCAEKLREQVKRLGRLAPSHKRPEKFHEDKSDIAHTILQVCDILEGNFDIITPANPKPSPAAVKREPYAIRSRSGNIVHVDFKNRRVVQRAKSEQR